ncbi:unnamed protein product [Penicillium salamii]|uniref:Uncharacterized protein n=1 Tax=Penicillium salamii TaxID=1612424 RepID=A0A9W4JG14_9EURO|nr:unnamed protein product [Penicillium salamii]
MWFYRPILLCEVTGTAETQTPASTQENKPRLSYKTKSSTRRVDRWLDFVVQIAGSAPVFLFIICGLFVWALIGIHYSKADEWVAVISDPNVCGAEEKAGARCHYSYCQTVQRRTSATLDSSLKAQSLFARCMIFSAKAFGHIITVVLYWVAIAIWLGFGHSCGWTNRWQLYINDSTSALMILVFAFLACLRECYSKCTMTCVDAIFRTDATIELKLRELNQDQFPNPAEIISPRKEGCFQTAIYYYADLIGTLVGIIVLVVVIIAWVAVGPIFKHDRTWWLLIGTYAGLVGLFDSFVLRNIQAKVHDSISDQTQLVRACDEPIFADLSMPLPPISTLSHHSLTHPLSRSMDKISSHLLMVVAGLILTIGCIVASSLMHWSVTGQLISNVPPSIIETFFMVILITGQNDADAKARIELTSIYHRRQRLLSFVVNARGQVGPAQLSDAPASL